MKLGSALVSCALVVCLLCGATDAAFEIVVPREPHVAVFGHFVVLPCTFSLEGSWDLKSIIITWQRSLEVIHSFYYGQDQLERQSHHYANRTGLYHSQLAHGNASLRLDYVTAEDRGDYTCFVSTLMGSQKKTFTVKFAAFYTEPRIQLTVSHQKVQVLLSSQGYPKPWLQWLDEDGRDITNETEMESHDGIHGLYAVSSRLSREPRTNKTLTFILRNEILNQEVRRELALFSGAEDGAQDYQHCRLAHYAWLVLGGVILAAALVPMLRKPCSSRVKACLSSRTCLYPSSPTGAHPEQAPLQSPA